MNKSDNTADGEGVNKKRQGSIAQIVMLFGTPQIRLAYLIVKNVFF
jgi:hypothetical protein